MMVRRLGRPLRAALPDAPARGFLLFLLLAVPAAFTPKAAALEARFEAKGAQLVLTLSDGRILEGEALIGITFLLGDGGEGARVRVEAIAQDASTAGEPIPLYLLSVHKGGVETPFCSADARGRRTAIALPDTAGAIRFTCTSGAEGKCVLLGYRPWERHEGTPMPELHQACVRMLRADYGGVGVPLTRDGTPVNIYDRFGIQRIDKDDGMEFEAAWNADGALCVAHPRIPEIVTLDGLAIRYPRLDGHLGEEACDAATMERDPRALIFNRSKVHEQDTY